MCKCKCYEKPVEPPFVRPKSGKSISTANITVTGNPLVTIATPATLYAMGNTSKVNTDILKVKEVAIDFTSSGSIPKLEGEAKADLANLVNFISNSDSNIVDELDSSTTVNPATEPPSVGDSPSPIIDSEAIWIPSD